MLFQMSQNISGGWIVALVLLMIVCFALVIFLTAFWILMIIDCVKRKKLSDGERIAWILVLIFLQFIGALIYYFAIKKQ